MQTKIQDASVVSPENEVYEKKEKKDHVKHLKKKVSLLSLPASHHVFPWLC